jgi:hypothetical protein
VAELTLPTVAHHAIGTPASQDKLIYEEKDDTYYVSLHKTTSKHYVVIHLASATTSEVRLLDAEMADAEPFVFLPRRKDHEYSLDHYQHRFYLRSNRHGKNFGLYRTRMRDEQQWEELIPPRENIMLEGFTLFTDWLVVEERQRGLTSLRQINRKTREVIGIAFDDPAYVTWIAYNPEPETARLRYGYSSMTTPDTLFELDMDTGERRVLKQTEVPGFYAANYRSEHLWIVARDGVEVPVSLVYHRKHFRKGHNPLLVYGYGSYGASIDADFSFSRVLPEMPGEWICTMKLARRLWPGIKYSNMALYKTRKLNVQTPPGLHHHRALYDCYITAALLIDIMNTSGWTAEQMADITGRPSLMTTFTFGKYRGKAVSDVAERDPGYLRWLFNNLDSMSPELRLTLKHYLENT